MTHIKGKRKTKEWPCQKCGWCCEVFLMDTELVNKYRHLFQRPVKKEIKSEDGKFTMLYTGTSPLEDDCVFLKFDKSCAIYDDRPPICKNFGRSREYECPNVTLSGRIRSKEEAIRAKNRIIAVQVERYKAKCEELGVSKTTLYNDDEIMRED